MKKLILGSLLFFAVQVGFAQSEDAKTYVKNMNVKEQLEAAKKEILPSIQVGKEADFTKEFDTTVNDFIQSFTKAVDENVTADNLKAANKAFNETKQMTPAAPKDLTAFQEKINNLQNEMGMSLQGLVMKYAKPEVLETMQE